MKLPIRSNPTTPEGWAKRAAIATLSGLAIFLVTLPVAFLLFLSHDQHAYPNDPQNLLSALTAAVGSGLALAALGGAAVLAVLFLLSLRTRPNSTATPDSKVVS
jgi:hypothetical protein